ncbi:MAG: hypothetical protein H2212_00090 [Ruminococcus sp.]|nr:hypothetical protein [Ruminococcus sp.]
MIAKPQGYDEAQAFTGEFAQLPAGIYVCVVKQVSQTETRNGRPQLAILYDIAEGENKGFYQTQYEAAKKSDSDAKWKGVYKQLMDGSSLPFFKGLMTSIEKSNQGFQFPWGQEGNEKTLAGKKFGAIMGREEFFASDGEKRMATKIVQIRSLDGLKDAKVPEDKLLDDNAAAPSDPKFGPADQDGFMNIPDGINEELPFM